MPDLGKLAYDAYVQAAGGKSLVSGEPLPEWSALPQAIRYAWRCAADAVMEAVC